MALIAGKVEPNNFADLIILVSQPATLDERYDICMLNQEERKLMHLLVKATDVFECNGGLVSPSELLGCDGEQKSYEYDVDVNKNSNSDDHSADSSEKKNEATITGPTFDYNEATVTGPPSDQIESNFSSTKKRIDDNQQSSKVLPRGLKVCVYKVWAEYIEAAKSDPRRKERFSYSQLLGKINDGIAFYNENYEALGETRIISEEEVPSIIETAKKSWKNKLNEKGKSSSLNNTT